MGPLSSNGSSEHENITETEPTENDGRWWTRKRSIAISVVVILVATPLFYDILNNEYEVDIRRDTDNPEEREVLSTVEELDLTAYTNASRYGWYHSEDEISRDNIKAYAWANFLDKESMDYYEWKIEALRDDWVDVKASLRYRAECRRTDQIQVLAYYMNGSDHDLFRLRSSDEEYNLNGYYGYIEGVTCDGEDTYHNFTPSYIVVQHFSYREYYAPLAAFGVNIEQIALLDEDMNLLAIVIDSFGWIA